MSSVSTESGQEVDLNIAPIIDCFTVLIAYLLVSASFISLGVFDVELAATGDPVPAAATTAPPPPSPAVLTVQLRTSRQIEMKMSGGTLTQETAITIGPSADGSWNIEEFQKTVNQAKEAQTTLKDVNLSGEANIIYRDVVRIVEELKKTSLKVFLSSA